MSAERRINRENKNEGRAAVKEEIADS